MKLTESTVLTFDCYGTLVAHQRRKVGTADLSTGGPRRELLSS
jgi:hypothetical protein